MKTLFKVLYLFLAMTLIFTQCDKDDPINPNPVNIPDNAFLNALIELGIDYNGDSLISYAEAEAVTSLVGLGDKGISDLRGIESFVNLKNLLCSSNQLTSLDVSNNTALKNLYCGSNQLTSLDVSNNTALERLFCGPNQLTSLDVSNNIDLFDLYCHDNQLTSLDVSNNTYLHTLVIVNMPTLYEVCVWTMSFPPEGLELRMDGSPNVYFTTECSK